ncbi:MAG: hypothetical protein CMK96_06150 [Pseudomonas sp.]|nr:hypothetical protein [Pseudomonas sp.]
MSGPETPGREPRAIVELRQKRCVNRYGVAPCTASGGPKCYNTYSTCQDLQNYDSSGSISWMLTEDTVHDDLFGDFSDPDNIRTNGIPCVRSVSTASARINPGANRDGESPFGVTGKETIRVVDIPWDDHVGDHYLADRPGYVAGAMLPIRGGFWRLFNARNDFLVDIEVSIYEGYQGEALAAMRRRDSVLENIDGPSFDGSATLTAVDPLKRLNDDKTQYPPASTLELAVDISAAQTSGIQVFGSEDDLTKVLGNDGVRAVVIDREFIAFTGYTSDGDSFYTLTGVTRGAYDSAPDEHTAGDSVQRTARFLNITPWEALSTILTFETAIPTSYIPSAEWEAEYSLYFPTTRFSRILTEPVGRRDLAGQISQQGLLYVWWEPYDREIKLLTVRPPSGAVATLDDDTNILDGLELTAAHEDRITRVIVYYDPRDVFAGDEKSNFARRYTVIDDDTEGAGVTPVIKEIYARWITSRAQAVQIAVRLLIRYRATPRFLSIRVDAKDREIRIGDITDIMSSYLLDTEGNRLAGRWQVIAESEVQAGHVYALDLQTYTYVGKFGYYMADGSPDYADATAEEREAGGWYADAAGEIDGDEGYQYQ